MKAILESFATQNPNLKTELCTWLASVLPKSKKLPPELKAIIGPVLTCLEDRSVDVRTAAQLLLEPLMAHVGPNEMLRVAGKAKVSDNLILEIKNFKKYFVLLKPSSITVITPLIEKARADLAAKQPVAPPSSAPPTVKPSTAAPTTKQTEQKTTQKATIPNSKSSDRIASSKHVKLKNPKYRHFF